MNQGSPYIKFLEIDLCLGDRENFSQEIGTKQNIRQAINFYIDREHQKNIKEHKKLLFSRESISVLNKRQRSIRKSNYQQQAPTSSQSSRPKSTLSDRQQNNLIRVQSATLRRPQSSCSKLLNRLPSERGSLKRPQTSTTCRDASAQRQLDFRRQNPLVIYPFEAKIKAKRVDDNPRVFASVISRKQKKGDKQALYDFISRIVSRKAG